MNTLSPLVQAAIGSILRWGLGALAGYLVHWGIWSQTAAEQYAAAAALALISWGWIWWNNHREYLLKKFLIKTAFLTGTTVTQATALGEEVKAVPTLLGGGK